MSFSDYLAILRSRAKLVVLVIIVTTAAAVALTLLAAPSYEAGVRLRVRPIAPGSSGITSALTTFQEQTDLGTEAALVTSTDVIGAVIKHLHLAMTTDELIKDIDVTGIENTSVLVVQARGRTPQLAEAIANDVSTTYIAVRRDQARSDLQAAEADITRQIGQEQTQLNQITAQLRQAPTNSARYAVLQSEQSAVLSDIVLHRSQAQSLVGAEALARGFGQVIQPADTATPVRSRSIPRSAVFGILIGVPLAIAAALLLETLRRRLDTVTDAERETGAPVIGVIPVIPPRVNGLLPPPDPFAPYAEAYRTLRHNLDRAARDAEARTILVTSPIGGDGKSTTVANLAFAYGEAEQLALIIDADLRRPSLHGLGDFQEPGLREFLDGEARATDVVQLPLRTLGFVAAGAPAERPDIVITARKFSRKLARLRTVLTPGEAVANGEGPVTTPDEVVVLLDSAPILLAAEVSSMAGEVDGVVLVLRAGAVTKGQAHAAAQQVERAGGRLLGIVLTGATAAYDLPTGNNYAAYRPRLRSRSRSESTARV